MKKMVTVMFDTDLKHAILTRSKEMGITVSDFIREAVIEKLNREEVKEAESRVPIIMDQYIELLDRLVNKLDEFESWLKVVAFWSALSVETIKTRMVNLFKMDEQQYERFKKAWKELHRLADTRIERLTGQRVWQEGFDPESRE